MSDRLYRLMLAHQRIDEALRRARWRPGATLSELVRLRTRRLRAKALIARAMPALQRG